jgi:hypothetical protein
LVREWEEKEEDSEEIKGTEKSKKKETERVNCNLFIKGTACDPNENKSIFDTVQDILHMLFCANGRRVPTLILVVVV